MADLNASSVSSTLNLNEGFDAPIYEQIAQYMLDNLNLVKQTISDQLSSMSDAEKQRAQEVQKQVDDYIQQLEQAKKMEALSTFLKILGPIFLIIAVLIVAICPSPMSVALLMVALAIFIEPYIAKAAGYHSIVEQAMDAFMKPFIDKLGEKNGAIVGMIVMSVIMIGLTVAMPSTISVRISSIARVFENFNKSITSMLEKMMALMKKLLKSVAENPVTENQLASLGLYLEYIQMCLMAAQGGTQIELASLKKETAELMHDYGIEQATIDQISHVIDLIAQDNSQYREKASELMQIMSSIFLQQSNPQLS